MIKLKNISKLIIKKIIIFIIFIFTCYTAVAQLDEGTYEGFKIIKNNKNPVPDLIDIHVNRHSSSRITSFTESKDKPLNGTYHIIIHGNKYIVADFSNGMPNGEWTLYLYNKVAEKAFLKNGKYDGEYHEYYRGHSVTTFKDGVILHHISHHPNGQLAVERSYENGKLHGEIKEYREDGSLYRESHYLYGKADGKQLETNDKGYTWIKNYKNGQQSGEYLEIAENGITTQQGYYNDTGQKTGRWISHDKNGIIREDIGYLDGKYHGEKRIYTDGQLIFLTQYDNGKYNGKDIEYYSSNPKIIRSEKNYVNDEREGSTKYYSDKGIVYREIVFRKGKEILNRNFDLHSGILHNESVLRDGRTIRRKIYNKNGKLELLQLADENGSLVDVQEYNTQGKVIKTNKNYRKPSSIRLVEDASGIIDIEVE